MSLFVRTIAGSMIDLRACPLLTIEDGGDGNFELMAWTDVEHSNGFIISRDRSRRNVETLLNQLAARANGEGSPIDADPRALRRGMRFGAPSKKQPSPGTNR